MAILAGTCILTVSTALLVPLLYQARDSDRRTLSRYNLKQIGMAMQIYHDAHAVLPPGAIVGSDGTLYHGWMTMILPCLDASPIYNRINLNVPWDDPVNMEWFQRKKNVYLIPGVPVEFDDQGYALSHYAGSSHLFGNNSSMKLPDITDGTAQTIMAGEEAGNYAAWGYPRNWRDPAKGINTGPNAFGRPTGDGAIFLFADGHTQFLANKIDPKVLQALSTPDGGEEVPAEMMSPERDRQ